MRIAPPCAVLVALLAGCARDPTEIVLQLDSDLSIPDSLAHVDLAVWSERSDTLRIPLELAAPSDLPRSLVLYPLSGDTGRFSVTVIGLQSTDFRAVVARRDLDAAFVPEETRLLRVFLAGSCQTRYCSPDETCDETGCRPIEVAPSELGPYGGAPPSDPPACVAREESCNDRDDDCDGERDDGFAFESDPAACGYCGHTCSAGACAGGYCDGEAPVGIAAGTTHTCVVRASGAVSCWGGNGAGQVGALDEAALRDGEPHTVRRPATLPLEGARAVSAGGAHTCSLHDDGTVRCWGDGSRGELGDGSGRSRMEPAEVPGLDAAALACGITHCCALRRDGAVACWGSNAAGQLGSGSSRDSPLPTDVVRLAGASAVAVGALHSCAVARGVVWCWGDDLEGQLGDGTTTSRGAPAPVSGLDDAVELAAGRFHTCARRQGGAVVCWGRNLEGQLGDGTRERRTAPVSVSGVEGSTAIAAAGGGAHSCALLSSGGVVCWGSNVSGQLGTGSTDEPSGPVAVRGLARVVAIAAGGDTAGRGHSCAVRDDGQVFCWGLGDDGQLGTYWPLDTTEPSPVEELPYHHVPSSAP